MPGTSMTGTSMPGTSMTGTCKTPTPGLANYDSVRLKLTYRHVIRTITFPTHCLRMLQKLMSALDNITVGSEVL